MEQSPPNLKAELAGRLHWFIFFHLGSDASVEIEEEAAAGFVVSVSHRRVTPFEFRLTPEQARRLSEEAALLEAFLLEHLTRHRK